MGNHCCAEQEEVNPNSKKLIRAGYSHDQITSNSYNMNKLNNNKKPQSTIKIYDVENNTSKSYPAKFSYFKSLDSISQISIGNCLYLLGEQGSVDSGSAFIYFDLASPIKIVDIRVNSIYRHYKPSLCCFKKDYLIAIGGRESVQCEIYHKITNKWRKLPDLPEERYGAGVISDDKHDSIYVFGGFNHSYKKHCKSVLKAQIKNSVTNWETLLAKNSSLLARSFFSLIRLNSNDSLIILGGKTDDKSYSNTIVEYNFSSKVANESDFTLNKPSVFDTNTIAEHENIIYILDDDFIVQKISRREAKCEILYLENDSNSLNSERHSTTGYVSRSKMLDLNNDKINITD